MIDPLPVRPVDGALDADVVVPGSKSYTNRALMVATLAEGESRVSGALFADDTEAMLDAAAALGAEIGVDTDAGDVVVHGVAGSPFVGPIGIDARFSGTTARFVLAATALGPGPYVLDGAPALRARPMADGMAAVRALGAVVVDLEEPDHLPVEVSGGPVTGGAVTVRGDASSQFLSGLLMAAPCMRDGLDVTIDGGLVSAPYVHMAVEVMRRFGAEVAWDGGPQIHVAPTGYRATDYQVEPDASAASYFFAAAAICGGRVRVQGLGTTSLQGDLRLAAILGDMGCEVVQDGGSTEVRSTGRLQGVEVDMADCSDAAQTLAAVAVFAESPTTITGIGFIRGKETDRIGAVVRELGRCGIQAEELPDGVRILPGAPRPAVVQTYDDHRMAMSFALIGLRVPGIEIADPGCVAKTFPSFFEVLDGLR